MERIMNIFSLNEIMNFLEASETQRPVTIRTNSLKIRRRDLAQVNFFTISVSLYICIYIYVYN